MFFAVPDCQTLISFLYSVAINVITYNTKEEVPVATSLFKKRFTYLSQSSSMNKNPHNYQYNTVCMNRNKIPGKFLYMFPYMMCYSFRDMSHCMTEGAAANAIAPNTGRSLFAAFLKNSLRDWRSFSFLFLLMIIDYE